VALTHLVDTSVLTRLAAPTVRSVIAPLTTAGSVGRCTLTDLEIGYSARDEQEWQTLMAAIAAFQTVETDASHIARARQVQRLLASRRQRGRKVPDLVVAAVAEASDLVLFHYDHDFDLIAVVTGQRCDWVVPAGSVD